MFQVELEYQSFPAIPSTGRPSTPTSDTATSVLLPTRIRTLNRKKKTASKNNEADEVMSKINKKLESLQEDSHDRFGKHVADRLRALHPDQLKFAMKLISDVLFEADILSLNRYSKIMTEDRHLFPQQSQRETRQQHFNQYAPPCITNTEANGQTPSQRWNEGYYAGNQGYYAAEIGQKQHAQQLQLIHDKNKPTPAEPANTNFTFSNIAQNPCFTSFHNQQQTIHRSICLPAPSATQFTQQTNPEEHHSLIEIGQQQVTSKQVLHDQTLFSEGGTDPNSKNIGSVYCKI